MRSDRAGTIEKQHIFQDHFHIIIRSSFHSETCDRRNRIGQRGMSWSAVDQQGWPRQLVPNCSTIRQGGILMQFKQGNVKPPDMLIWHCKDVARQEFDLVSHWLLPSQEHGSGGLLSQRQFPPLAF